MERKIPGQILEEAKASKEWALKALSDDAWLAEASNYSIEWAKWLVNQPFEEIARNKWEISNIGE